MPAYVVIPKRMPGTDAAYLGATCLPFETIADPAKPGPFAIPNLGLADGISVQRLDDREALLNAVDKLKREADQNRQFDSVDRFRQQAFGLLTSDRARKAFDLDAEPASIRERYGFQPEFNAPTPDRCDCPAWSQRILLARRLVEAGVRLVTVDVRRGGIPMSSRSSSHSRTAASFRRWDHEPTRALLEDPRLQRTDLLESTLVVAWGEIGRTPKRSQCQRRPRSLAQCVQRGPGRRRSRRRAGHRLVRLQGQRAQRLTPRRHTTCSPPSTGISVWIRLSTTTITPAGLIRYCLRERRSPSCSDVSLIGDIAPCQTHPFSLGVGC